MTKKRLIGKDELHMDGRVLFVFEHYLGYEVSAQGIGLRLRKKNDLDVEFVGYLYFEGGRYYLSAELQAKFDDPDWDRKNPPQDVLDICSSLSDAQGQYSCKGYNAAVKDVGDSIVCHHDVFGRLEKIIHFLGLFKSETFEGRMDREMNNGD